MNHSNQQNSITASQLMIALSDTFPDLTYGAIPVADHFGVLEKYFANDECVLANVQKVSDLNDCKSQGTISKPTTNSRSLVSNTTPTNWR